MNTSYKQNDRHPTYTADLQQTLGPVTVPIDLTGTTVKFIMRDRANGIIKVLMPAVIVVAAQGRVSYPWAAGDLDTVGVYDIEWEITFPGAGTLTVPAAGYDRITVVDDLS